MFEKILSSIGIGAAKVTTVLLEENVERGGEAKGEVRIYGGKVVQKVSEIYIHMDSEFHKEDDETTDFRHIVEPLLEVKITDPITIIPKEEKVIPFSFFIPYYIPVTFGKQKITIETEIDIQFHIVSLQSEVHELIVRDPMLDDILQFLTTNGFRHTQKSGQCRHKKYGDNNPTHCLQTFILQRGQDKKVSLVGNEENIGLYVHKGRKVQYFAIKRNRDLQEQLEKLSPFIAQS